MPSPACPPSIPPPGPVPVRFGREGTAWRSPSPPPGFPSADFARRAALPARLCQAPAAPLPGRPHGDALRLSSPHPRPPRARTHPPASSPPPPQCARRAPTVPTQPHAAPLRSPAPRPCAAPHCCAPAPPRTAAPLHRTTPLHPRRARRPHVVRLLGPPPATGRSACAAPRPPRAPHPHGAASASAARRYPRARPRPRPPGDASSLPLVPQPAVGPASGAPTPLHTRPPRPGLRGTRALGAPGDPMEWGSQGHCRLPAGPPTPPRDCHGPCTRMAPPPPRPPAATHAAGPGLNPPADHAARPPAHGTQGRSPGDRPYIVPAPSTPVTPPPHRT